MIRTLLVITFITITAPASAHAQSETTPFGFNLGVGIDVAESAIQCDSCDGAFEGMGVSVQLGYFLNPDLRVVGDVHMLWYPLEDDISLNETVTTVGLQVWLDDDLSISGGLGAGVLTIEMDSGVEDSDVGAAAMVGAAYEIGSNGDFVFDVRVRAALAFYEESEATVATGSLGLGATWY